MHLRLHTMSVTPADERCKQKHEIEAISNFLNNKFSFAQFLLEPKKDNFCTVKLGKLVRACQCCSMQALYMNSRQLRQLSGAEPYIGSVLSCSGNDNNLVIRN